MSEMPSLSREWQEIVSRYRLDDFEHVWSLSLERVDKPNQKGQGWSEVCLMPVETDEDSKKIVFVKRQHNYFTRKWPAIWTTQPTFRVEYHNILRMQALSLPVVEPLVYMESELQGNSRAIFITIGLEGYVALSEIETNPIGFNSRDELIKSVAKMLADMHGKGLQHGCLYSKHIFARKNTDGYDVCLIDLEKLDNISWSNGGAYRDLDSLNRHARNWQMMDRARFLKYYCSITGNEWRKLFVMLSDSYKKWIGK